MAKYLCNALSLQMVDMPNGAFTFCKIAEDTFKTLSAGAESYVGHKDLAKILGVPYHRANLELHGGDVLFVAQLKNGRLEEGATQLPHDKKIEYYMVTVLGSE